MAQTEEKIRQMYKLMYDHFGPQHWWPGDGALEICVGAILTQNTNWSNVEKAITNLKNANMLTITALHECPPDVLAEFIRPAGYYNRKAKRLKNFIADVYTSCGDDIEAYLSADAYSLRERLLAINGIGRETADSMVLYAANKCVFVVDAYTARIMQRHELLFPEADYEEIRETFEAALATDVKLFNEYHALIVATGKKYCRPRNPKCTECPLGKMLDNGPYIPEF